ncbi:MAG: hypothetical protein GX956_08180 [Firmicutes bacterium]|nr:hypothetical protein [Bacillota bacterium]
MKKINAALFALILSLSLLSAPLNLWAQEQEAVATVNGVVITREQFIDLLEEQFGPYALQELIQRELVNQKAEALQVSIDDEQFAEIYEVILQQLGGPQGLYMFLMQNNATEEQFKEQVRWNMLLSELASSEVEVTEEALAQWFEQNQDYYDTPEMVEVSHILVDSEEEAKEILASLKAGEDFEALAKEKSQDPGSAVAGGYLGNIEKGITVPEFEETAFSLPIGEFGLAQSMFGWHIVLVHEKTDHEKAVFSEIRDRVERDYRSNQALDARSFLNKLETDADIDLFWQPR